MTIAKYRFRPASLLGAAFATLILFAAIALADELPDNLMDYGGDYTDGAVVPSAPLETNYRVSRGYDDEARGRHIRCSVGWNGDSRRQP